MISSYKCCKKQLTSYYCCVICNSILHKSCSGQKKDVVYIDKHKIYCSKLCADKGNESKEEKEELQAIIKELKDELAAKDLYIHKQRRQSQAFEDDVLEIEINYNKEIDKKNLIIRDLEDKLKNETEKELSVKSNSCVLCNDLAKDSKNPENTVKEMEHGKYKAEQYCEDACKELKRKVVELNKELKDVLGKYIILQEELKINVQLISKLHSDLEELNTINKNMVCTIKTLEVDNNAYFTTVKHLQQEIFQLQSKKNNVTKETVIEHLSSVGSRCIIDKSIRRDTEGKCNIQINSYQSGNERK